MKGPWLVRWGWWAWARKGRGLNQLVDRNELWERVWWRLWRCRGVRILETRPKPTPPPLLHFIDYLTQRPLCGERIDAVKWTIEWQAVTCPKCKEEGRLVVLQHEVNTR